MAVGIREVELIPYKLIIIRTQFTDEREIKCWEKKGSNEIYEIVHGDKVVWDNHKLGDDIEYINRFKEANPDIFYRPCYIMCVNYEANLPLIISYLNKCDKTISIHDSYYRNPMKFEGERVLLIDTSSDVDWM